MKTSKSNRQGGNVSFGRLLTGIAAAFALSLVLAVASASAKTVYDYEYSGTYFDGSGAGKTFTNGIGGVTYDPHQNVFLVGNSGEPGWITKINAAGNGVNFTELGSPQAYPAGSSTGLGSPQIAIDQSESATEGRFYAISGVHAFNASGTERSWQEYTGENLCGITVTNDGKEVVIAARNGMYHHSLDGEQLFVQPVLREGVVPGVGVKVSERNRACRAVYDDSGDLFGMKPSSGFSNARGKVIKVNDEGVEEFEVNQNEFTQAVAIDHSTNELFALISNFSSGSFEMFDSEGRYLGGGWGGEEGPYEGISGNANGITVDPATHDVWVANGREYAGGVRRVEKFVRTNPHVIPDVTALNPHYEHATGETVTLAGTINPDGVETTDCHFEYGVTEELGTEVPCEQGNSFTGSANQEVTAKVSTPKGALYYYKLSAKNGNEQVATSNTKRFVPQGEPKTGALFVDRVNTDGARLTTTFDPNGGPTSFHFEWGVKGEGFEQSTSESNYFGYFSEPGLFSGEDFYLPGTFTQSREVGGLKPGTTYEYRTVVTNQAGTTAGTTQEFTTYVADPGTDPCPNAQVRQQTEASLLPDCRAYEQVSAANTGGYDVESDLVPTQAPLTAYPRAKDRLLYSVHFGLIPGVTGSPTNDGPDPYLATRGPLGWSTSYVGIPADGMADEGAFGAPLFGADSKLSTFAFGGKDICDPCYPDGSINIPLRRSNGTLEKGMAGALNPAADPVGEVRRPVSDDGTHLIFGSNKVFESAAEEGGSMWIYSRNLVANTTQLVSTTSGGTPLSGELAELDVSSDGSRVLVGKVVGEDGAGNRYYAPYMHIGNNPGSYDLAPGTTTGVQFAGMTDDGTRVFFSSRDKLTGDDTDESADLFEAEVTKGGEVSVSRVSTGVGGTGNTDACEPVTNWNVAEGGPDCGVVGFADGAGVAANDGTVFFISPEKLDGAGNGVMNQANLYVVTPGGSTHFVGVLDSSLIKPGQQPDKHPLINNAFATSLSQPQELAVDQSNGDLYVLERTGSRVSRFDSTGAAKNFTEGPDAGTNTLTGLSLGSNGRAGVAVDNASGSFFEGDIYVKASNSTIKLFSPGGEGLGEITGFGDACGVAVDQGSGDLYVADRTQQTIWRLEPTSGTTPVEAGNYTKTGIKPGFQPCAVAVDSSGHAYAGQQSTFFFIPPGPIVQLEVSEFEAVPPTVKGTEISAVGSGIEVDPATENLYVNEGDQLAVYDSEGNLLRKWAEGEMGTENRGVAVRSSDGHVFAPSGESIYEYGVEPVPYIPIDHPGVRHGVLASGTHHYEDFQITPDGRYALFSTVSSLTGYQSQGHSELFRYDTVADTIDCVSCAPTGAIGGSDVTLSDVGLNLADDGRAFFTTLESFALRDTNEKKDAYEWNEGKVGLISTGVGQDDSGLVTVSADGTDAFFYTRDTLVPTDQSGNVVKVYDAREGGGYGYDPPRQLCAASDECHGAGTQAPGPPIINTVTGAGAKTSSAENRCQNLGRRAKTNSNRAKSLRNKAKKAHGKRAEALRRKAKRSAKQARKLSKKAKSCQRSSGGNG